MKIVAGLGCIDDYIRLAKAGADEVFCGFVPYEWNKKYKSLFPLNRREVLYYNIQINSLEDMKILKKMVDVYKVPVTITFNYLYYLEEQYEYIASIMNDLINIGFNEFIISDIALILYLNKKKMNCNIQLSGECAEINSLSIDFFNQLNITRYIFHRKNTINDMKSCIENNKIKHLEYEAFILNERCHFTGAFCNSLHCDEMIHLCKMMYELQKVSEDCNKFKEVEERIKDYYKSFEEEEDSKLYNSDDEEDNYMLGSTGCGLCSLKKLKECGVTHLKVVGRGNSIENMERDVQSLKKAIGMLEKKENEGIKFLDFENAMKSEIFHGKCSGECYYKL